MDTDHPPSVTSFVIRFVHAGPGFSPSAPGYRGTIRHVQTDQEVAFTRWDDVVDFVKLFVSIEDEDRQD
jgi:hypothetical protein